MAEVDKVKWLQEHGPLPQFGPNIRIIVDKEGNVIVNAKDAISMKTKTKGNNK